MRRTDELRLHGRRGLDRHQGVHQVLIDATPELRQGFG
jgi:hypothetical protein